MGIFAFLYVFFRCYIIVFVLEIVFVFVFLIYNQYEMEHFVLSWFAKEEEYWGWGCWLLMKGFLASINRADQTEEGDPWNQPLSLDLCFKCNVLQAMHVWFVIGGSTSWGQTPSFDLIICASSIHPSSQEYVELFTIRSCQVLTIQANIVTGLKGIG